MKRIAIVLGLLLALTAGAARAQTRVGITLSFGEPHYHGYVVIGRPYYPYHHVRPYYRSYRQPIVVIEPREVHRRHVHRYRVHRYRRW